MTPRFLAAGGRVIVSDFFGFGRSDKPTDDDLYTFDFHRGSLTALVERLDLSNVTMVGQDWGGIIGLTLPMETPDRFVRILAMNTALPDGNEPLSDGFLAWRKYVRANPNFDIGGLMRRGCPGLSEAEVAAYDAPFPNARYKAGV